SRITPASGGRGPLGQTGRSWGDLTDVLHPDLAVVELWGKWGIIDRQGKLRTPARLDWYILRTQGLVFSEGRARIVSSGKVGYVGREGRIAIRPRFARAEPFSGGLARVMVWERRPPDRPLARWGYIDRCGEWVWKPTR
ncbi:MAG: WG repeat-containing protein, partial [Phycisphaerae bacterium]